LGTTNGNGNGNGKWQLAFWIVAAIATIGLVGISNWTAANDIRNTTNHETMCSEIDDVRYGTYNQLIDINNRLAKIEAKLDIH